MKDIKETIITLRKEQAMYCKKWDEEWIKRYDAYELAINALDTVRTIQTIIDGTLQVQGYSSSLTQEDVLRYKAICKIMEEFTGDKDGHNAH